MSAFGYARPRTLSQVFDLLDEHGPGARVLAGGTDFAVGLRAGVVKPRIVVDLKHVPEIAPAITVLDGRLSIAALTVLADIARDVRVGQHFPALVEAVGTVGSIQIRNRATLTGNICNASPAADTAPALLVYDADIVLLSARGPRRLPLPEFLLGPRRTALRPGELATAIELPLPRHPVGAAFSRLTRRRGVDLATVSVCCRVDGDGTTRFGYGAVGPKPFVVSDPSGVLADPAAGGPARRQILDALTSHADPIGDVRAGREYRLAMIDVLSRRTLRAAIARCREEQDPCR